MIIILSELPHLHKEHLEKYIFIQNYDNISIYPGTL